MKIGNQKIGSGNPVYIIAEAGINHNGDIDIAKEMIKYASKCGADAIKFQTLKADELFSRKVDDMPVFGTTASRFNDNGGVLHLVCP